MSAVMAIVVMGVSGCGKTSVGMALAEKLGWPFFDGDEHHPPENVEKMSSGIPLGDNDRAPWLENLHQLIGDHLREGKSFVLACSALKDQYRGTLVGDRSEVVFVYLKGSKNLIESRMRSRTGHYMKAKMLKSQFDDLEEPKDAVVIDIDQSIPQIVAEIIEILSL